MSRDLPATPNLDHLKKQAKDLVRERRGREPRATLASAQHALARHYGFKSWLVLKRHVEHPDVHAMTAVAPDDASASGRTGGTGGGGGSPAAGQGGASGSGFARYTMKAREALFFSRYEAAQLGGFEIEPGHLLVGLVRVGQAFRNRLFERAPLEHVTTAVTTRAGAVLPTSQHIPFSDATTRALAGAIAEADELGHAEVGVVHVLLGLLRDDGSRVAALLDDVGLTRSAVVLAVERYRDETVM